MSFKQFQNRFVQINNDDQRRFDCNSLMIKNSGTVDAFINNVYKLQPGEAWASNMQIDCIDITEYIFRFDIIGGKKQLTITITEQLT